MVDLRDTIRRSGFDPETVEVTPTPVPRGVYRQQAKLHRALSEMFNECRRQGVSAEDCLDIMFSTVAGVACRTGTRAQDRDLVAHFVSSIILMRTGLTLGDISPAAGNA